MTSPLLQRATAQERAKLIATNMAIRPAITTEREAGIAFVAEWKGVLNLERSIGIERVHNKAHHIMELHQTTNGGWFILWEVNDGEYAEEIGLEFHGGKVDGYDGVMSFPDQALALLDAAGIQYTDDLG